MTIPTDLAHCVRIIAFMKFLLFLCYFISQIQSNMPSELIATFSHILSAEAKEVQVF